MQVFFHLDIDLSLNKEILKYEEANGVSLSKQVDRKKKKIL